MKITWENIGKLAVICLIFLLFTILGILIIKLTLPEKIINYKLASTPSSSAGPTPGIIITIENGPDDFIYLGKDITFQEANQMIDSLNQSLK